MQLSCPADRPHAGDQQRSASSNRLVRQENCIDVRVVPAESEQMVKALQANHVPVTYLTFPDEGHGFVRPENRLAFAAVAEAFLARHLGGQYQPLGNDFAGSTIRIETGGELVPGLKEVSRI